LDKPIDRRIIDPNGDVVFAVSDETSSTAATFLVSTRVLGLASAVFHAMFQPHFEEGLSILNRKCPTIDLGHDDPLSLEIIFQILHHQSGDIPEAVPAEILSKIAILCDKYDCAKPIKPWVLQWLGKQEKATKSPAEFGFLLEAAYVFDAAALFADISAELIMDFQPKSPTLISWPELHLIPAQFIGKSAI
jgi:hypothetical protein